MVSIRCFGFLLNNYFIYKPVLVLNRSRFHSYLQSVNNQIIAAKPSHYRSAVVVASMRLSCSAENLVLQQIMSYYYLNVLAYKVN